PWTTPDVETTQLNRRYATISVTTILKVWAIRNAYNGLLLSALNKSENLVSRPMLVKASTNHKVWTLFKPPCVASTSDELRPKENKKEAALKPSTNLEKRSHNNFNDGLPPSRPSGVFCV